MQTSDTNDALWRPDVTVATIVPRAGKFLLVEEIVRDELVLNQPAGHLEPDESLHAAALRETLEETGWTVELTDLIGVYQWSSADAARQFLRFAFAATADCTRCAACARRRHRACVVVVARGNRGPGRPIAQSNGARQCR